MVLGLTGGIGSGKSVVARLFEVLGCAVFNSDQVAKEVYFDPGVKIQVLNLLGEQSYLADTGINKPYISSKIFDDTGLLHALNRIIHPAVADRFKIFKAKNPGKIIIKETALLFEAGLEKQVDKIVLVTAGEELRISRVMARDHVSREAVMKKIKSQLPQEDKIIKTDFIINNNEETFLTTQVLHILKQIAHA